MFRKQTKDDPVGGVAGKAARNSEDGDKNFVYDAKRLIGKKFSEIKGDNAKGLSDIWHFDVEADEETGEPVYKSEFGPKKPKDAVLAVIRELRRAALARLGKTYSDDDTFKLKCVATVPAYF